MAIESWRNLAAVLLFALAGALQCAAQAAGDPPKELVLYVRDAQRRGLAEAKIRQQAQTAGWPAALIDKAIGGETTGKPAPAKTPVAPETTGKVFAADDYQIGAGDSLQISVW